MFLLLFRSICLTSKFILIGVALLTLGLAGCGGGGGAGVSRDRACRERRQAILVESGKGARVAFSDLAGPADWAALGLDNISPVGCQPLIRLVAVQGVAHSCWRCRNLCRAFWVRMRVFR